MINKLFEPISIGPLTVPNRIVMTAMHLNYTPTGEMTDQFVDFYRARARGGAGLIVIGGAAIDEQAVGMDNFLSIMKDADVPGLKRFVDAIHAEGGVTAVQLYMAGGYSFCDIKGLPVLAPSSYVSGFSGRQTTAMTLEDIQRVQNDYVQAARRAKEAGFDGVEILASAGYLISQFLSPRTNKRDDEYGGPLENRVRFGREVIEKVRAEIGPDLALIVRVAGNDFVPGSNTNVESRVFAKVCQDAGADLINVTGGWHESRVPQITMDLPRAGYVYLARGIKEAVDIPVVGCNRINDPLIAEDILRQGVADMVGVARGFIADPEFGVKAKAGRLDEIRRCVACNQRCFDYVFIMRPVGCMVNPRAGRESQTGIEPVETPKKIIVVGAGPAGCEFAYTAARRGHKVTIIEKEESLGGQVRWFAPVTRKPEFLNMFRFYAAVLTDLDVEVRLGVTADAELIASEKPDLVVVATGAAPFKPPIDVVEEPYVVQAWDVLKGAEVKGPNIVIVGGGSVGLETAVFLARQGTISPNLLYFLTLHEAEPPEVLRDLITRGVNSVTVIEMAPKMGQDIGPSTRWVLMKELKARSVQLITSATMKEITSSDVVYTDSDGNDVKLKADTVVLAMGSRPENSLALDLEKAGLEVRIIGDAAGVAKIGDAIQAGFDLGREV